MNKEHRTLLRKNRMALVEDLEPNDVVNYLYQEGILSENDAEMARHPQKTRQQRAEYILDTIPRRGPKAFDAFYKALLLNQNHLAFLLKCNVSTEETQKPGSESSNVLNPTPILPTTTPTENENDQTEGLNINPRPPLHPNNPTPEGTTMTHKLSDIDGDAYPMKRNPHGVCLIVNNATFEAESCLANRKGSNIDARNLQSLFLKLNYKVRVVENLRARNLKDTIMRFAGENHSAYDSVVLCLLSHGLEGKIYGVDGGLVVINDLISMFNGYNAKTLIGKPKLFFIQACRGGEFDRGIAYESVDSAESSPSPLDNKPVDEVLEELYPNEEVDSGFVAPQSLPSEADILIAYSTVPGFVSWRHSDKGSWFVQALIDVFKEYSPKEDVASMLVRINRKVALEFESTDKKKQMPAPVIMLTRKVFFFPQSQ